MTTWQKYVLVFSLSTKRGVELLTQSSCCKRQVDVAVKLLTDALREHIADSMYIAAEAQHVILTEPLLDPAVEAQAVGRVHRIGQTQPTFVHRY